MSIGLLRARNWLENILAKEFQSHRNFFGQEFDLSDFRTTLERYGPQAISWWQNLGLEPHFLPEVAMLPNINFPGWKIKPWNWYYEQVATGRVLRRQLDGSLLPDKEAFRLPGKTVLIDTRLKPQYKNGNQMFKKDNLLGPIIKRLREEGEITEYKDGFWSSRFGVSTQNKEWEEQIKPALAKFLDVEVSQVRLELVIEVNVIPQVYPHMPRKKDGRTNTWVWCDEYYGNSVFRFDAGCSDYGGLSVVYYDCAASRWDDQAIRPLVVLN